MSCDVGEVTESSAHSPTFVTSPTTSSFSNPSVALPTSQLIILPFRCITYVTAHSPTLLSLLLCHRLFTYVTWRAAHEEYNFSNLHGRPHSYKSRCESSFFLGGGASTQFFSINVLQALEFQN